MKGPQLPQHLHVVLHRAADETDDAADHDELHAAGAVAAMMQGAEYDPEYIYRWLDGLKKLHNLKGYS